jgi:hypothetical protein
MPYTLEQAESAMLAAKARFARWYQEFVQGYYKNAIETSMLIRWFSLPPEQKAEMKKVNPEAYAEVEAKMNALRREREHAR